MGRLTKRRAQYLLTEAEGYVELGVWDEARELLEAVVQSRHFPAECAVMSGRLHIARGEFGQAVPFFEEALRLKPGDVQATFGLGWCLKRVGKAAQAARAYEAALAHHPKEPILHYNLACYRSLAGETSGALESLGKALTLEDKLRELASEESDFDPIRNLPEFQRLIAASAQQRPA